MALIDKLRDLEEFPLSHIPGASEIAPLLGRLIAYVEHGDSLFEIADQGTQELSDLLGRDDTAQAAPIAPQAPPAAAGAPSTPAAAIPPTPVTPPTSSASASTPAPTPAPVQEAADASGPAAPDVVQEAAQAVQDPGVETQLADLRAQNATLAQQVQTLIANQNRTTVSVEQDPTGTPVNETGSPTTGDAATHV